MHRHNMSPAFDQKPPLSSKQGQQKGNTLKQGNVLNYGGQADITLNFSMSRSFLHPRDIGEVERDEGSIQVDSFAFNASKVIATERKLIAFAETDRELTKIQNGDWLKQRINSAKRNEVIMLKNKTYKFHSLFIGQPITLIGQAGTILEIDGGSIFVDFLKSGDDHVDGEYGQKKATNP